MTFIKTFFLPGSEIFGNELIVCIATVENVGMAC